MAKPAKSSKVFDVTKPGKTPANATARPVIVGHGAMLRDPMVNEESADAPSAPPLAPSAKKVLTPSAQTEAKENPAQVGPTEEEVKPEAEAEQTEPQVTKDPDEKPAPQEPDAIDAAANKALAKKEAEAAQKATLERQAALEKLIADKKYFVPIAAAKRKRQNTTTIILLFALFVLVGGYLALDAGIIKANVTLPVDLIKN
jgi:hypothetical protein